MSWLSNMWYAYRKTISKLSLLKGYGTTFFKEYNRVASIKDDSLLRLQDRFLKTLILHAYINVPYYKDSLHNIIQDITKEEFTATVLKKLPIITKKIIRRNWDKLVSSDVYSRKWYYNTSGGSTGDPIRLVQDNLYDMWGTIAYLYYYKVMLGLDEPVVKKVLLWGSERDIFQGGRGLWKQHVKNRVLLNTVFLNTFKMTKKDMERYVRIINSFKPIIIRGYATSLYELARYIEKRGTPVWSPKVIVSTAEVLTNQMRETITRVFNARVYNFYGSREVHAIAGECDYGLMHIFSFHNLVEVLRMDKEVHVCEGEEGRVVITNLHNYSMPLIRYEIGDRAVLGPEKCRCGSPLPTLKDVTGRVTDNFVTSDGSIVHGEYFTHLFYLKDWVKSFKVIQEDYKKVRLLVAVNGQINAHDVKDIEDKIRLVMGKDCQIVWEFLDDIPLTREGKHLYTLSLVWTR